MGCGNSSGCGGSGKCGCKPTTSGGGGLLTFSGITAAAAGDETTQYFANQGFAGGAVLTDPLAYPNAVKRTLKNLAVSIDTAPATDETLTVTVLKNGVATGLTLAFTSTSDLTQTKAGTVPLAAGDTFDLRAISSGGNSVFDVSATVGVQ